MSANGTLIAAYPTPVELRVRTRLNVRAAPTRTAALVARRQPYDTLLADQLLDAETFLDNSHWYRLAAGGQYVWAGGVDRVLPAAALPALPAPLQVNRRQDGTIRPLDAAQLNARYGPITALGHNVDGSVTLAPPWEANQIVDFLHPLLANMGLQRLRVHRMALATFQSVFDSIQAAGPAVSDRLLTCDGAYFPRHVNHSRDPSSPLSSHTFGIALDLNSAWNGYGSRPAAAGLEGSLHELVPYFAHHGFAWGGHFTGKSCDGMHFELAVY